MLKKIDDFASFIDCVTYYSQGLTILAAGSLSTDSDFPRSAVELLENCERVVIVRDSKNKLKFFYFFIIENDGLQVWFNALTGELQVSTSDEVATTMLPSGVGEAFLAALPKVEDLYVRSDAPVGKAVKFREVNADLCYKLMQFVSANNVGQSVVVDGVSYKLHSYNHVAGVSRRLDVYYTVGRSVIRISDVWSKTNYHDRSKKLNSGGLKLAPADARNVDAVLLNSSNTTVEFGGFYAGKYPWVLKAGIASKSQINKFSGLLGS